MKGDRQMKTEISRKVDKRRRISRLSAYQNQMKKRSVKKGVIRS